jgi:NitT/TauT family transport system substrate-binding protein
MTPWLLPQLRAIPRWVCSFFLLLSLVGCRERANGPPADKTAGSGNTAASDSQASAGATTGNSADAKLLPVTLQLNWYPEAEHGGFYAAQVDGLYRREGLDVTILPGGPETPVPQLVTRGAATFGVVNADNILFSRAQQLPVVALMAPLQTSPRCLMVHASAGMRTFADLKDMTLAMSNSQAFSFYLRKKVPLHDVRIVPYAGSVAPFLHDPNYGQQAYVFSEPFVAKKEGGDPQVLMLADLGFNPYTSLLFTSEKTLRQQPELVRKMVAATVAGWARYLEDPGATNALIHRLNPQMDMDILDYGAQAVKPLVLAGEVFKDAKAVQPPAIGWMTRRRWQELADQIVWCGQLKPDEVDVDKAFTAEFLPK